MEELPPEILLYILEYVNNPSYLANTIQTCSMLASIAKLCPLYKFLNSYHYVTRVAGGSKSGHRDGDAVTTARFYDVRGLVFDNNGDLIITDNTNNLIRKLCMKTNQVSTFKATEGKLRYPHGIAVDKWNNIFIADSANGRIVYLDGQSGELKILHVCHGKWMRRVAIAPKHVLFTSNKGSNVECIKHPQISDAPSLNWENNVKGLVTCGVAVDDNENIYFTRNKNIYKTDKNFVTNFFYELPMHANSYFSYSKGRLFFGGGHRLYCLFVDTKDLIKIPLNGVSGTSAAIYHEHALYFAHNTSCISKIDLYF